MGTRISFPRIDGKPAEGYLAKAGHDHAPGVVVIQEWWGLQDQIRGICDRLALAGYDALAPDLYAGRVVAYHDHAAAQKELQALNLPDAAQNIARAAAQYLKRSSPKVGITGFCMGGAVALMAASAPEISCVAPFYGLPPEKAVDPSQIKVPIQGHYSNTDEHNSPERAAAFAANVRQAGGQMEIFLYDADHAFMNEQRDVHDRAAAELAWGRVLAFFAKNLQAA